MLCLVFIKTSMMNVIVQVCIPQTNRDFFDYSIGDIAPCIGARVWVPFRKQRRLGVVIGQYETEHLRSNIKCIASIIDDSPLLSKELLQLCQWVSEYYQATLASVLTHTLPKKYRQGVEDSQVPQTCLPSPTSVPLPIILNNEQQEVVNTLYSHLEGHRCFLLQGVTGSGKTEVYFEVIQKLVSQGRQILLLVPEIGLTPQLLTRIQARFQVPIVAIHSQLNDNERKLAWQAAKDKVASIILGTRAAIFTPIPALGLIIVDEEHDTSFKQMSGVHYSARDTALMRAYLAKIPIILGSATPSLETLHNCIIGKYSLLRLTQRALSKHPLQFQVVDMRHQHLQHGLAPLTLQTIQEHLEQDNQVLVFINRRGFAPILLCHQCGWMADCRACDSHLVLHKPLGKLICHHCGLMQSIPTCCGHCPSVELIPIGAGTQRIHEFLAKYFSDTCVIRIDRDETRKKNAFSTHLDAIHKGDAKLIIGTQMLAKGHHFPRLSLVVIVDADNGFYNQDFRALERLGQLITQVAGRAGRAEHAGQVLIQTHIPQHPLLSTLLEHGYDGFAQALLHIRQSAHLPPYCFLALIRTQAKEQAQALQFLHSLKTFLGPMQIQALGPAPAPLARKANYHRFQLLLKSSSRTKLKNALHALHAWINQNKLDAKVRWNIDMDPMDLS